MKKTKIIFGIIGFLILAVAVFADYDPPNKVDDVKGLLRNPDEEAHHEVRMIVDDDGVSIDANEDGEIDCCAALEVDVHKNTYKKKNFYR
jgi:hypothetical protein